jgi:DNA helicase INO80
VAFDQLQETLDICIGILVIVISNSIFPAERKSDKMRLYNFDSVKKNRRWLRDVLISDTSDSSSDDGNDGLITEQDFQEMLRLHLLRKKYQARYYTNPEVKEMVYS